MSLTELTRYKTNEMLLPGVELSHSRELLLAAENQNCHYQRPDLPSYIRPTVCDNPSPELLGMERGFMVASTKGVTGPFIQGPWNKDTVRAHSEGLAVGKAWNGYRDIPVPKPNITVESLEEGYRRLGEMIAMA